MSGMAFQNAGLSVGGGKGCCASKKCARRTPPVALFDKVWENVQRAVVQSPGNKSGGLEECPFCEGRGHMFCDPCTGTGKNKLGTCVMCNGTGDMECTVCSGIGKVDIIRRGGTDAEGAFTKRGYAKRKGQADAEQETD